jgi:hypothetical protein
MDMTSEICSLPVCNSETAAAERYIINTAFVLVSSSLAQEISKANKVDYQVSFSQVIYHYRLNTFRHAIAQDRKGRNSRRREEEAVAAVQRR